jgi:hypothetical protein
VIARLIAPLLAVAGLAAAALAAPRAEVLREEAYNYRVLGSLPVGWTRAPDKLAFTYKFEGVPHTYVHFTRERVSGRVDVREELGRRRDSYRFPGVSDLKGKPAEETIQEIQWAGRNAWQYEHTAIVHKVACRRIVRALFDQGVWYECIETHHGEPDAAARAGLACFRGGFRILVDPLPKPERNDSTKRSYISADNGFRIDKPEGFVRIAVRSATDPGCRLAFERRGPAADDYILVRVFEYGVRKKYAPLTWTRRFSDAFARSHVGAKSTSWVPPTIKGARNATGLKMTGHKNKKPVTTDLAFWQSRADRVIALRVTVHGQAGVKHAAALKALVASLALTD